MHSRSTIVYTTTVILLSALSLSMAMQAGYLNSLSGTPAPHLWKTRYSEVEDEREELAIQMIELESRLKSSEDLAEDLQLQHTQLETQVSDLTNEREDLEKDRGELLLQISQLASEYESKNKSCAETEGLVVNLTTLLNQSAAELDGIKSERDLIENLYADAQNEIDDLQFNLSRFEHEVENLTFTNAELNISLAETEQRLGIYEEAISLPGEIYRKYEWFYLSSKSWKKGISGQSGTGFNRSEYLSLAAGKHLTDTDEDSFRHILETECQDVNDLSDHLYSQAATDLQRANNMLKFVQYLPYIHDVSGDSYVRSPLETLVEGGGDCEDTSVLAAKIMRMAGFPVVLLMVDTNNDDEIDHMMVGVSVQGATGKTFEVDGTEYYVCETTSSFYRVGQIPSGYEIHKAIEID